MGVIFNIQNSYLLTLSLPTEEIFQVNSQKRPLANLPAVISFSATRTTFTKANKYVTFGFSFRILALLHLRKFEHHCL